MLKTKIIKINPKRVNLKKIKLASNILKEGGLVAYPTDTVYGLAANSRIKKAVERIYQIKRRPRNKPLPIQLDRPERLKEFNINLTEEAKVLIDKFWPGPLTLILETKNKEKIGFRIPDYKIANTLLEVCQVPLCVSSANFSGDVAGKEVNSVIVSFDGTIEAIIDGGSCPIGIESTVVDLTSKPYRILREGAISLKELETSLKNKAKFIKVKKVIFVCTGNSCRSVMAKGLLLKEKASAGNLNVESAGTTTLSGMPPTAETIEIMAKEGIDVSKERSKSVSDFLINKTELILVMQPRHKEFILDRYPKSKGKVYLLKEYKNKIDIKDSGINDPIGQSIEVYKEVLKEIKREVKRIKKFI